MNHFFQKAFHAIGPASGFASTAFTCIALVTLVWTIPAHAGEADVMDVKVVRDGETYRFDVTVEHADEGWDHYADKWEVLTPNGEIIATRVLAHPHVNEQPFSRSKSGIVIPEGISEVVVRAGDSVHEYGGKEMRVAVPGR